MAKSKPIGVRFDLEKLEIIKKEQNLTSTQAVVNYFMDSYGKSSPNLADKPKLVEIPIENQKMPPKGLKGIDLMIWKSENGI